MFHTDAIIVSLSKMNIVSDKEDWNSLRKRTKAHIAASSVLLCVRPQKKKMRPGRTDTKKKGFDIEKYTVSSNMLILKT